jgi:DNA-binding winged helix-turn-helix (wHTH) protein/Tol biopolymer transport system component
MERKSLEELLLLEFGPYRIDREQKLLFSATGVVPLAPKTFETLLVLVENHDRVVTKEALLQRVWPDTFVEEGSLARNVSILRKALGKEADDQTFIETVPKRGYRFVAAVRQSPRVVPIDAAPPTTPAVTNPDQMPTRPLGLGAGLSISLAAIGAIGLFALRSPAITPSDEPGEASVEELKISAVTTSGYPEMAAISADGKFVAYAEEGATRTDAPSLRIRQITTHSDSEIVAPGTVLGPGATRNITGIWGVTISPDGSFVDYVRSSDYPAPHALWRIAFLGGQAREIVADVRSPIGWSPDGRHMAFVRTVASQSDALVVADAHGAHERVVARRRRPAVFQSIANGPAIAPAWSPDGTTIALPGSDSVDGVLAMEMVFVNVADGLERIMTRPAGNAAGLGWLDDKTLVLSAPAASGLPQLWRLSYPDGRLSRLTNDLSGYEGVSLTADRNSLVTVRYQSYAAIWVGDGNWTSGSEAVPLSANDLFNYRLAWAGKRLLYTTTARGYSAIMRMLPGSGTPEEIIPNATSPAATSDGRTIVFQSTQDGPQTGLWRSDGDGRNRVQIATGSVMGPVVTADDRFVVFRSARAGMVSAWIVSIDGGIPTEIAHVAAVNPPQLSPDGKSVLIWSPPNAIICNLPTCSLPRPAPRYGKWTPDGRGLAFTGPDLGNIWVQPLDGSSPRPLTRFTDKDFGIRDFGWSHDGSRLAIARNTGTSEAVMFTGLRR